MYLFQTSSVNVRAVGREQTSQGSQPSRSISAAIHMSHKNSWRTFGSWSGQQKNTKSRFWTAKTQTWQSIDSVPVHGLPNQVCCGKNLPKPFAFWSQRWQDCAENDVAWSAHGSESNVLFSADQTMRFYSSPANDQQGPSIDPNPQNLTSLVSNLTLWGGGGDANKIDPPGRPSIQMENLRVWKARHLVFQLTWSSGKDFTTFGSKCWQETIKHLFRLGCFSEKACDAEQRLRSEQFVFKPKYTW